MINIIVFSLFIVVILSPLIWKIHKASKTKAALKDRRGEPPELQNAKLEMVECLLKADAPFPVVGKPDRVYVTKGGFYIPLDLKTRDKSYNEDVIQLSLQAWLLRKNNMPVAQYGYVLLKPFASEIGVYQQVKLMSNAECERVIERHIAVINNRVQPSRANNGKCKSCEHKDRCGNG